jgi:hypothetical protein
LQRFQEKFPDFWTEDEKCESLGGTPSSSSCSREGECSRQVDEFEGEHTETLGGTPSSSRYEDNHLAVNNYEGENTESLGGTPSSSSCSREGEYSRQVDEFEGEHTETFGGTPSTSDESDVGESPTRTNRVRFHLESDHSSSSENEDGFHLSSGIQPALLSLNDAGTVCNFLCI